MRLSRNAPPSWLASLVASSMFLTVLPALAADTAGAGQLPETTILQGTVTITTTSSGRFT
jgi:hypothetical protein